MESPNYILHNDVHESWAESRLHFLFIGIESSEPPELVADLLAGELKGLGIHSFAIYDVLGEIDIAIRCWIPTQISSHNVRQRVNNISKPLVSFCRIVEVNDILLHWPWSPDEVGVSAKVLTAADNYLHVSEDFEELFPQQRLTPDFIRRLNAQLRDEPGGLNDDELTQLSAVRAIKYVGAGTQPSAASLHDPATDSPYIKTITLLSPLRQNPSEQEFVRDGLKVSLQKLQGRGDTVGRISLYDTQGSQEASFVVMAQIRSERFHAGIQELLFTLGDAGYRKYMKLTPTTLVVASPAFLVWHEQLPTEEADERQPKTELDIEDLLQREEGDNLEFKSTFYADLRRWLLDGDVVANENLFLKGIVKEVAAFLNSDEGGTLLVGVCQVMRELEHLDPQRRKIALGRLTEHPRKRANALIGWNLDCQVPKRGRIFRDEDSVVLHLHDRLTEELITVESTVGRIEITVHRVDDREITAIRVRPLTKTWAYTKEEVGKLFVKRGSSTIGLEGPEADDYRLRRGNE